jgi:acetyl esterase/lipase
MSRLMEARSLSWAIAPAAHSHSTPVSVRRNRSPYSISTAPNATTTAVGLNRFRRLRRCPMFVEGKPNLADPRCAWYIAQIKAGSSLSSIVPDGDYARCDPVTQFSAGFPPTYFLHGKEDVFVGHALSERAAGKLEECGVEVEIVLGEEIGHAFDLQPGAEESESWGKYVVPALEWLVSKAL